MITPSQIKQIHILKNLIGIDEELYRDMLASFDVCSSKKLTKTEAQIFIEILEDKLKTMKITYHRKYDNLYSRDNRMATPLQLRKIEAVWKDIVAVNNIEDEKKSLRHFLNKHFHIDDIRFIQKARASKIIAVLEKIKNINELKAV